MLHYKQLVWSEMSESEKMIVFNEWKAFKQRKEEMSLRNERRRLKVKRMLKFAEEQGYSEDDNLDVNEEV